MPALAILKIPMACGFAKFRASTTGTPLLDAGSGGRQGCGRAVGRFGGEWVEGAAGGRPKLFGFSVAFFGLVPFPFFGLPFGLLRAFPFPKKASRLPLFRRNWESRAFHWVAALFVQLFVEVPKGFLC